MSITRKDFLVSIGLGALAAGCGKAVAALAPEAGETGKGKGSGKRWGMVIDFQKCRADEGCRQCIGACDHAHNIPNIPDAAHEVKWIWKEQFQKVFPFDQNDYTKAAYVNHPLPLLCNHCADPACTRVCPTQATWKRDVDGIVMMDWHRCIGCRYCMAACPYGSRSFNFVDPRPYISEQNPDFPTRMKGVVEKCNFCEEHIDRGEMPVCVGKCEQKALVFGDLNDPNSDVRKLLQTRFAIQRQPELGTGPAVYYLI